MNEIRYDAIDLDGNIIVRDVPSMTLLAKCLGVDFCTVKNRLKKKITKHQYNDFSNNKTKFNVIKKEVSNGSN